MWKLSLALVNTSVETHILIKPNKQTKIPKSRHSYLSVYSQVFSSFQIISIFFRALLASFSLFPIIHEEVFLDQIDSLLTSYLWSHFSKITLWSYVVISRLQPSAWVLGLLLPCPCPKAWRESALALPVCSPSSLLRLGRGEACGEGEMDVPVTHIICKFAITFFFLFLLW